MDVTDVMFPIGTILAIREPFYKFSANAEMPIIRVDAPSDIVVVDPRSPLLRGVSWSTSTVTAAPRLPTTAENWKERGNGFFKCKQWMCAAISFSEGLKFEMSVPQSQIAANAGKMDCLRADNDMNTTCDTYR